MMTTMAALLARCPLAVVPAAARSCAGRWESRLSAGWLISQLFDAVHHAGDLHLVRPAGSENLAEAKAGTVPAGADRFRHCIHEYLGAPSSASPWPPHSWWPDDCIGGRGGIRLLPVVPLPQVEFPTISVNAGLPGQSRDHGLIGGDPLERQFGRMRQSPR